MKQGWQSKTLDELCEIARGGSPRPIKSYLTDDTDGVNWIKISDATASLKYIYKTKQKIKPEGIRRSRLVHEGDFLLSNSMSFGRPYIMRTSGCIHDGWLVLSDKSGLFEQDYLYHFLGSPAAYEQFDSRAAGSTVRNLNIDLVRSVEVPIPLLEEQKRIVAILDEAFEGIEKAQANAEQNLANARELFDTSLNNAYSSGNKQWKSSPLSDFINISHGYAFKGPDFSKSDDPSLPIVLTPGNYSESCELYFTNKNTKRLSSHLPNEYLFQKGDLTVVMTDLSSKMKILGKPAFIDRKNVLHNQRIGRVLFKNSDLNSRFLYFFLRTRDVEEKIKETATGTMVRHTAPKRILSLNIPVPDKFSEQMEVVSSLDQIAAETQRLEAIYEQKLKDLAELKQSLLQKAFSGELTSSNVVAFTRPVSAQQTVATTSPEFAANVLAYAHNWHASQQRDRTFGRVKAQKVLHMAESVAGVDMGRQPIKDAAGPNDFQHMLRAEDWAKNNLFFEFTPRLTGNGYDFKKLGDYNKLIGGALEAVKPYKDKLEKILALMMPMNTREAEVLATVHAAWNNLLLDKAEITDDAIIHEARENWTESKRSIPENEFRKAITTIRNNGIVPDGTAKRVTGQESLPL